MADAVAFKSIEKQDLVCFGYSLFNSNVPLQIVRGLNSSYFGSK